MDVQHRQHTEPGHPGDCGRCQQAECSHAGQGNERDDLPGKLPPVVPVQLFTRQVAVDACQVSHRVWCKKAAAAAATVEHWINQ